MIVSNRLGRVSPLAFLSLMMLLLLPQTAQAQEAAKTLEWGDHANYNCRKNRAPDPKISYAIELEDILINGRSLLVGEPFVGDVRELVFVVKNISDRSFAFIQVDVMLPEVKIPIGVPFVRSAHSTAQPVKPGEQAELRVPSGKVYDWVKDAVSSQGMELSTIKRAAINGFIMGQIGQASGVCAAARDPRNQPPLR